MIFDTRLYMKTKNKIKLRVEILYDNQKKHSDILIWEGMVLVARYGTGDKLENNEENQSKYRNTYIKELTKGTK